MLANGYNIPKGKIDPDCEEDGEIFEDFAIFVTKFTWRQGWELPTHEEITHKWEELGGTDMRFEINSLADLAKVNAFENGKKEGEQEGEQKRLRKMLKKCITLRFPRMAQATINSILSIADVNVLDSIFDVACTAESLENFQRDIRGLAPVN